MSIQPKTVVVGRLRPSMKITMLVVGRLRPSQEMGLKIATCRPATAGKNRPSFKDDSETLNERLLSE